MAFANIKHVVTMKISVTLLSLLEVEIKNLSCILCS